VLATQWHGGNFTAGGRFIPGGVKALFGALPAAGIIFADGGFEQSDQLAGEIKDPRHRASASRPYRMPAAAVLVPAAFAVANLLIYWSGFEVIWKLGIVLILGYLIMAIFMAFDPQRPPLNWKPAVWIPVWLIGLVGHPDRHRVQRGHLPVGHAGQAGPVMRCSCWSTSRPRTGTSRGRTSTTDSTRTARHPGSIAAA
jgi:hypothetical protein